MRNNLHRLLSETLSVGMTQLFIFFCHILYFDIIPTSSTDDLLHYVFQLSMNNITLKIPNNCVSVIKLSKEILGIREYSYINKNYILLSVKDS